MVMVLDELKVHVSTRHQLMDMRVFSEACNVVDIVF